MTTKLVVDTNSILNFSKYYYFDLHYEKIIYNNLIKFIATKIKSDEIIIIDKVYDEIKINRFTKHIKDKIKPYVKPTISIFDQVENLITKYYIKYNERFYNNNQNQFELELRKYEQQYADLYLIAYCNFLKEKKEKPIIITEETRSSDTKLIEKIPTICIAEKIEYQNLPYVLFNIYKNELKFNLTIS